MTGKRTVIIAELKSEQWTISRAQEEKLALEVGSHPLLCELSSMATRAYGTIHPQNLHPHLC